TAVTGLTESRFGVAMREPVTTTSVSAGVSASSAAATFVGAFCACAEFATRPAAKAPPVHIAARTARRTNRLVSMIIGRCLPYTIVFVGISRPADKPPPPPHHPG